MEKLSHRELIDCFVKEMRFYHWCCIPEPTLHSYEKNFDYPVPDIMMFKRDYKRKQIVIAEIKVHRADFLKEMKTKKYEKAIPFADKLYYVAPRGMIKPKELPENWGLYEHERVYGKDYFYQAKYAKAKKIELHSDILWSLILSLEKEIIKREALE